jgi:DNA-directed RNA polymerase specialized sigma subunit
LPIRYHELDDLRAREELVERFLTLARDLARRYAYTDESFKDLLQVASEIGVRIGYSQMHVSRLLRRGSTGSRPPPHGDH